MSNAFQTSYKYKMFSLRLCRDRKGHISESTDGALLCPNTVVLLCAWPGAGTKATTVSVAQAGKFKPRWCDRLKNRSLGSDVVGAVTEIFPRSWGLGGGPRSSRVLKASEEMRLGCTAALQLSNLSCFPLKYILY